MLGHLLVSFCRFRMKKPDETKPDEPQPTSLDSISDLEADKVGCLISAVAQVADARLDLLECRTEIVKRLHEMVESTGAMWTWGVADEAATAIAPVATISVGFTAEEKTAVHCTGLDPSMHEEFRIPIMKQMQGRSQITTLRTDLYDDRQWKATRMYANQAAGGCDEWVHCVRNSGSETWSSLWMMRRIGEPPFLPANQQLIDLAMRSIPWLGAMLDNSLPVASSVALTSRQRIVLMMQLDGLSRKEIADRLQISLDTVGDHTKKIYEHFGISSAGELAALFLRNH